MVLGFIVLEPSAYMPSSGAIPTNFRQTAKGIAVVAARKFYGSS
jgi:hypothetical protein